MHTLSENKGKQLKEKCEKEKKKKRRPNQKQSPSVTIREN
jgi:hypothetical protein